MTNTGELSIVIIPLIGGEALRACLQAVEPCNADCIVVYSNQLNASSQWEQQFPWVRFLEASDQTVPELRARGVMAASHEIVAIIEDTSLPEPGWCEAIVEAFSDPNTGAAGGPVSIAHNLPARYQALGCTEYGRFHTGRLYKLSATDKASTSSGVFAAVRLPGNNIAYLRSKLIEFTQGRKWSLFEIETNDKLLSQGLKLALHPRMAVSYNGVDHHNARLFIRMQHGRLFASGRVAGHNFWSRLLWGLKSLILPVILSARTLANARIAVRPAAFPKVAIWIVLMETAWAFGECVGYIAGKGRSQESWR